MRLILAAGIILLALGGCMSASKTFSAAELDEMRNYTPNKTAIPGELWAIFNDSCLPYYGDAAFGREDFNSIVSAVPDTVELSRAEKRKGDFGEKSQVWRLSYPTGHIDIGISVKETNPCAAVTKSFAEDQINALYQEIEIDPRYQSKQKCLLTGIDGVQHDVRIYGNHLYRDITIFTAAFERDKKPKLLIFAMPDSHVKDSFHLLTQCAARIR